MKKSMFVVTIILLLSLVLTTTAMAGKQTRLPTWEQVFDPAPIFGEGEFWATGVEFKNTLYFGGFGDATGGQMIGTRDGKHWSLAWKASSFQEGFEAIGPMHVFKNQLYISLDDFDDEYPSQIMRTPDGKHWELVATEEWADDYSTGFCGGSTLFQGAFYRADCYWSDTSTGVRLLRSTSGDPGTWEVVAQFPDWVPFFAPLSFETFKGALYMISDFIDRDGIYYPAEIWRSFDGVSWELVITPGFGDETNIRGGSFGQKSGYLYASMGYDDSGGGDIYRTKDGLHWEPVTTDGFGDENNLSFAAFVTYQGRLYAYAGNWSGIQVYSSKDGVNWTLASEPGLGDPRNYGVVREYGRVIFKGNLYTGVMGPGGVYRLGH